MAASPRDGGPVRFGVFEADLRSGELRKSGVKIKLRDQPFQVLAALLERPGEVVTREELRQRLWPDGTFVDFDHSLNTAINKIRQALGDSADNPRFVETLPKRGYRFVYPVKGEGEATQAPGVEPPAPASPPSGWRRVIPWGLAAVAAVVVLFFVVGGWRELPPGGSATPRGPFVAVLPLENLSGDPEQEYFSDGMTDALISDLGNIGALTVISRTSVMQYKESDKPLPEIARELNVSHIVEGSVLRAGDQVRITTRLIDALDDQQLWSDSYEGPLKDVLALQSDVAQAIAREIEVTLKPEEQVRLAGRRPVNPEAQDLYFRGRFYESQGSNSIDYYQRAIELDPGYALAHVGLAGAYMFSAWGRDDVHPKEAMAKAKAAALRAVQLDPTLDEAQNLQGTVSLNGWEWSRAKAALQRALALNRSGSGGHGSYAYYLMHVEQDFEGALAMANRARELDPRRLLSHSLVAHAYHFARRYDQAIAQYQKTLELDPDYFLARNSLGKAYADKGMYEEAIAELKKAILIRPVDLRPKAYLAYSYALANRRGQALEILNEFDNLSKHRYVSSQLRAVIHTGLGDTTRAFEWLDRAYQEHDVRLLPIRVDPVWDPLRPDPRFQDLLKRMNLTD